MIKTLHFAYANATFAFAITVFIIRKFQASKQLASQCGCAAWFVSVLVGNPKDRFYWVLAHM